MLKKLLSKKVPQMIGLDIGSRAIKAVLLNLTGEQYKVQAFACEPIIGNAFADREIKDFDAVSNALRKVKMALKVRGKDVVIAVSGSSVLTKVVYMDPDQSDYELEQQIEIEADSLIPHPLEDVYLDFEELGPSKSHEGKVEVLLSAAHKDIIDQRITLIRELEFEPKIMDIENYALANAAIALIPEAQENKVMCVNVGANQLQVVVVHQDKVIYQKEHMFGVDSLIQDLCIVLGQDRTETEQQLLKGTLPATWRENNYPIFLANLQQHLSRAIQMYVSSTHQERPGSVYLAGGAANIPGIAKDLESELAMPIQVFNPFANFLVDEKVDAKQLDASAPQLAIATGLALRSNSPWHI